MPASASSPVDLERALGGNLPLLTYGLPYCQFTNDHNVAASLRPWWPSSPISSSPPFKIPPTPSHPTLTTSWIKYSTAAIEKDRLPIPYAADSDSLPDFQDTADSEFLPTFTTLLCRSTFLSSTQYTIRYLLQSYNLVICISLLCNPMQSIDKL